ncbi:hypothetical protein J2Z57_000880 [Formosa algae]|uniref:Uncharacterized protein n=1 Tax=Formosa algae TaxID=225843 RepID=A0A9X0YIA2_9FLAO|nr:hypothetical protein [Formosa algae]MDQ0334453.1 hypothetical protein [Formosa algae]
MVTLQRYLECKNNTKKRLTLGKKNEKRNAVNETI